MPYWINISGRTKGQKFMCSACFKECNCISIGSAEKWGERNICDYDYCPRCGLRMQTDKQKLGIIGARSMRDCDNCEFHVLSKDGYYMCSQWNCVKEKKDGKNTGHDFQEHSGREDNTQV